MKLSLEVVARDSAPWGWADLNLVTETGESERIYSTSLNPKRVELMGLEQAAFEIVAYQLQKALQAPDRLDDI